MTNNSGLQTYTFFSNGTFTFTFIDDAGNEGSTIATVNNIDQDAPSVDAGPDQTTTVFTVTLNAITSDEGSGVASYYWEQAVSPTPVIFKDRAVEDAEITLPSNGTYIFRLTVTDRAGNSKYDYVQVTKIDPETTSVKITNVKIKNGSATLSVNGKSKRITPFSSSYHGSIWAKKVNFGGTVGAVYLFAPGGKYAKGTIKVYDKSGKIIQTIKPYGGFALYGLNVAIDVDPTTKKVLLAVGTRKAGTTARTYNLTNSGLQNRHTVKVSNKPGEVLVKFLAISSKKHILTTGIAKDAHSIRAWKYKASALSFARATTYESMIKLVGSTNLRLK
jgi:hypothetical protein